MAFLADDPPSAGRPWTDQMREESIGRESRQVPSRHVVFALTLLEADDGTVVVVREAVDASEGSLGDLFYLVGGHSPAPMVVAEEREYGARCLQFRLADVEIDSVERLPSGITESATTSAAERGELPGPSERRWVWITGWWEAERRRVLEAWVDLACCLPLHATCEPGTRHAGVAFSWESAIAA
jgi:hypothetical protein